MKLYLRWSAEAVRGVVSGWREFPAERPGLDYAEHYEVAYPEFQCEVVNPGKQAVPSSGRVDVVEPSQRPVVCDPDQDGAGIRGRECRNFPAEFVTISWKAGHELQRLSLARVPQEG